MTVLLDRRPLPLFRPAVLEPAVVGALAGAVSVHVVLRRLPFFVVAMSHATFPGVVLASVLGLSLFLGGTAFGLVVVAAVLVLGHQRVLDETSVIGVVLAGSFAVGVLVLSARPGSSRDLSAFLVGSVLTVTWADVGITTAVGIGALVLLGALHKELVFTAFDPSGATASGYRTWPLDAAAMVVVTVTLVAAVPSVGTLLAVALLTVPALTARLWCERIGPMMAVAAGVGALSGVLGLDAAALWGIAGGAAVALAAGACFVVSLAAAPLVHRRAALLPGSA